MRPEISVIIPTYNREDSVLRTLESLAAQDADGFEVLVVNNAAVNGLDAPVAEICGRTGLAARVIHHPRGGSCGARNRGASEARGALLLFTDDDLDLVPGWVRSFAEAFAAHPEMPAAAGRVHPLWEAEPPAWLLEYMAGRAMFPILAVLDLGETFRMGTDIYFYSCNQGLRREVFETTGFRPEIFGARTLGNGESSLCWELQRAGRPIGYVPGALARHRTPAGRMTLDYVRRWARCHQSGSLMYERLRGKAPTPARLAREVAAALRRHLPAALLGLLLRGRTSPRAVDAQFATSRLAGDLRYLYWVATDPKVRALLALDDFRPATGEDASWRGQQATPPELRL